ncbi:MAG TPA: ATP-dependent helicase [Candidatus Paceibacterota bacterium]
MAKPIINPEAYKAENGPIALLAGPGTGKTWQLAKRIQYLTQEKSVSADAITVITFTAEAARSMRHKIEEEGKDEYVEPDKRPKRISTIHSFGYSILKNHADLVGLQSDFSVAENQLLRNLIMRDAALSIGLDVEAATKVMKERTEAKISAESQKVIDEYERILRLSSAIDYDDQITLANKILRENETIRKKYAAEAQHLLVDEYQDINQAQFDFIELLSRGSRNGLFVVGDDDQSIYGFRGGSPEFIREFEKHFGSGATVFQIDVSRRCAPHILDCAVSVVSKFDTTRVDKGEYKYTATDNGEVVVHNCPSDEREAEVICGVIFSEIEAAKKESRACDDFFVLVPNKFYAENISRVLSKAGLRVDRGSEKGDPAFQKVAQFEKWRQTPNANLSTRSVIEMIIESGSTSVKKSKALTPEKLDAFKKIAALWKEISDGQKNLFDALSKVASKDILINDVYQKMLELQKLSGGKNTSQFLEKIATYIRPWSSPQAFLDSASKAVGNSDKMQKPAMPTVRILTFQSSKGLEAAYVFIVGLEEGAVPRDASTNVAEEARLFFVAMTRAKKKLHLFHCRKRSGSVTLRRFSGSLTKSRFLNHLPDAKKQDQYHQPKTSKKGASQGEE